MIGKGLYCTKAQETEKKEEEKISCKEKLGLIKNCLLTHYHTNIALRPRS
jgi:hypothetical protein